MLLDWGPAVSSCSDSDYVLQYLRSNESNIEREALFHRAKGEKHTTLQEAVPSAEGAASVRLGITEPVRYFV